MVCGNTVYLASAAVLLAVSLGSEVSTESHSQYFTEGEEAWNTDGETWPNTRYTQHASNSDTELLSLRGADSISNQGKIVFDEEQSRSVLLQNGTADDSISLLFVPEDGFTFANYSLLRNVSDTSVLNTDTDIELSITESNRGVNVSVHIDFNKFAGRTNLSLHFRREDGSSSENITLEYLVSGFQIFRSDPIFGRELVSGADHSLQLDDYSKFLDGNSYVELDALAQFLNGSSSSDAAAKGVSVSPGSHFGIDSMRASVKNEAGLIEWDEDICSLTDAVWDGGRIQFRDGCGLGLVVTSGDEKNSPRFLLGINVEEYRVGSLEVTLDWDRFTEGTEFEDETMTTQLNAFVRGNPPAVVTLITPSEEFSSDGGQDLYVEMINARNASMKAFHVEGVKEPFPFRPGTYRELSRPSGFYEAAIFRTTAGRGKRLKWNVEATRSNGTLDPETNAEEEFQISFVDRTGYLFSYDNLDTHIYSVTPPNLSEQGGDKVTLTGSFEGFDANKSESDVLLSNKPLNSTDIVMSNDTHLLFYSPPRSAIGIAWSIDLQVRIGASVSEPVAVNYIPERWHVETTVFGGSLDEESSTHIFGRCSHIAVQTSTNGPEFADLTYEWFLYGPDGTDILSLSNASHISKTRSSLMIDADVLPVPDVKYRLVVVASNSIVSGRYETVLKRTEQLKIGVTLINPPERTVAKPATNLRIIAKVEMPSCVAVDGTLVYEWEFGTRRPENTSRESAPNTGRQGTDTAQHEIHMNQEEIYANYRCAAIQEAATGDGESGALRLCRELIIPRGSLRVGTHRVRLRVFEAARDSASSDSPVPLLDINGSILEGITIGRAVVKQSSVVALIGNGETSVTLTGDMDFEVSAAESYDPDAPLQFSRSGLKYTWKCRMYWKGTEPVGCSKGLFDASIANNVSFVVSSTSILQTLSVLPDTVESVYVLYSLTVTKGDRQGECFQTVEVTKRSSVVQLAASARTLRDDAAEEFPKPERLRPRARQRRRAGTSYQGQLYKKLVFTNAGGVPVNIKETKFWEELVITPVIADAAKPATSWKFDLVEPRNERNTFFISDKLISQPGYYYKREFDDFMTAPLGIRDGALKANTKYAFRIVFLYQGADGQAEVSTTFEVSTVELPRVIFPPLPTSSANASSIVRVSARTNMEDDSAYVFQFYLKDEDQPTDEYCVDGCTGAPVAVFQTHRPGIYTIEARLLAANGKTVLDTVVNEKVLQISPAGGVPSSEDYMRRTEEEFQMGDDGSVNMRGFLISKVLNQESRDKGRLSLVALGSTEGRASWDQCLSLAPKFVEKTLKITQKEQPTTASLRNTVLLATKYAGLACLENETFLYELLQIVVTALERTPSENTLQLERYPRSDRRVDLSSTDIVQEVQLFYNFSITRAVSGVLARGSSRRRLAPTPGLVSNIILDLYEKWREHVITVSTSDKVCGYERSISTEVPGGIVEANLLNLKTGSRSNFFGSNIVYVAVRCNVENGLSLQGRNSRFEWCPDVFDPSSQERKLTSLAEMYDYVYLSGIQGDNRTDSKVLVAVNITVLGEQNQLVPVLPKTVGVYGDAQNSGNSTSAMSSRSPSACYSVGLRMHENAVDELASEESQLVAQMSHSQELKSSNISHGFAEYCRFRVFTLWPLKRFGFNYAHPFESGAYLRRSEGIYEDTSKERTNSSFITVNTAHLGLYGALRPPCGQLLQHSRVDVKGELLSVLFLVLGILLLVVVVSVLTYVLATTLLAGDAGPSEAEITAEAWVERDAFGRGEIRLTQYVESGDDTDADSDYDEPDDLDGKPQNGIRTSESVPAASNQYYKNGEDSPPR